MKTKPQYRIVSACYSRKDDNDEEGQLVEAAEALFEGAGIRPSSVEDQFLVATDPSDPASGVLGVLTFGLSGSMEEGHYLFSVVTHPDHRGQGIATELVCQLELAMKQLSQEVGCIEPSFFAHTNDMSRGLLERLGFVPEAGQPRLLVKRPLPPVPAHLASWPCLLAEVSDDEQERRQIAQDLEYAYETIATTVPVILAALVRTKHAHTEKIQPALEAFLAREVIAGEERVRPLIRLKTALLEPRGTQDKPIGQSFLSDEALRAQHAVVNLLQCMQTGTWALLALSDLRVWNDTAEVHFSLLKEAMGRPDGPTPYPGNLLRVEIQQRQRCLPPRRSSETLRAYRECDVRSARGPDYAYGGPDDHQFD
jgi:GNAT superfamily N-acetyltransferase